ncbi:cell division ATP-binding protein FtsE [Desulfitibacter alkalitolerans]|uniref:cell division ATP-binding protein FtsE n=1 Tax=Desulfitibacter alkalitolerans TaxID=264641 RepID=UPI00047FF28C
MIQFCSVTKVYDNGTTALNNINLKVEKGDFLFLVGPSGAGKSTLLSLLFREEIPSKGQIFIAGKNIVRIKRRELPYVRRNMGIVFQDFRLLPDRTVFENVAFTLEVLQYSKRDIMRLVPPVLEQVGISHRAKNFPRQLSGGEQQRTAIARAIINNPPILVADEPTGNLDPKTSIEIMKILEDINYRGTTMLVATHDKDIVNSMHKRVVALENGKLARDEREGSYA